LRPLTTHGCWISASIREREEGESEEGKLERVKGEGGGGVMEVERSVGTEKSELSLWTQSSTSRDSILGPIFHIL